MRTKTKVLSALLGVLGTASLMAQSTNVYSLNAVGYINVSVVAGYNMISCPLMASPDNTLNTVLNNASGVYNQVSIYSFVNGAYLSDTGAAYPSHTSNTNGWVNNGVITLNPGQAVWFDAKTNATLTFVGTVPQGSLTNVLNPGFNLVSTAVPTSGDIITNSIMNFTNTQLKDAVYSYTPAAGYLSYTAENSVHGGNSNNWSSDPIQPVVGGGFWYDNSATTKLNWVENFSVNP
jgi:hypothetical protein